MTTGMIASGMPSFTWMKWPPGMIASSCLETSPTTVGSVIHFGPWWIPSLSRIRFAPVDGVKIHRHTTPVTMNERAYGNRNTERNSPRAISVSCTSSASTSPARIASRRNSTVKMTTLRMSAWKRGVCASALNVVPSGCSTCSVGAIPCHFDNETRIV